MQIIDDINRAIADALEVKCAALHGLAEPIIIRDVEDNEFPAVIERSGESHSVLHNDDVPYTIYHRLQTKSYTTDRRGGSGDEPRRIAVYDISLVATGHRAFVSPLRMESVCTQAINNAGDGKTCLTDVVQSNFNRIRVYSEEFPGISFPLEPEIFAIKINYRITRVETPCTNL